MAPIVHALRDCSDSFESPIVCSTGQHEEMLDAVLSLFGIKAGYRLHLLRDRPSLPVLAARAIERLAEVMDAAKPDWVLCQGDTTSALAAALVGFYSGVRVGHVEAGLRTYDPKQPYPEEVNRRVIAPAATLHFAPTAIARDNLLSERIPAASIHVTGNTVIDAIRMVVPIAEKHESTAAVRSWWRANVPTDAKVILVTGHRRENWQDGLMNVFKGVRSAVDSVAKSVAVYPVHANPAVREIAESVLGDHPRIFLLPPQDYASFTWLMSQSHVLLTDSGGVQEEGPALGKPVLVFRNVTERPEGVAAGTTRLVGTDPSTVFAALCEMLQDDAAYQSMARAVNPFGDGHAAERIVRLLEEAGS